MKLVVYVEGRRVTLDPSCLVGRGGEAEVFAIGDGRALKVFKGPDHPEFAGQEPLRRAAEVRLALHQQKLRDFPARLPAEVVTPRALATDRSGRTVLGYAMDLVTGAEPLWKYSDGAYRRAGVPGTAVVALFRALFRVVHALHAAGVVIGDFNDQNVLVLAGGRGHAPRVIDTDSFQFGAYACPVYSERFLDPRLCDPAAPAPTPTRAYDPEADWFAFNALLFQSLLFVGPYGGIHRPRDPASRVAPSARALRRLTVFDSEVQYPKPAAPYQILPDDLLHHFEAVFANDARAPFPAPLLEQLAFTLCPSCGTEHARALCPKCARGAVVRAKAVAIHGAVHAEPVFRTLGVIVYVAVQDGELRVVHHHDGAYRREDGRAVLTGALDPGLRFRIAGDDTLVGRNHELAALAKNGGVSRRAVDSDGAGPAFDASAGRAVWVHEGRLWRDAASALDPNGANAIGDVLSQQTRIFAGSAFGIGFCRAGAVTRAFLFDRERRGIDDRLQVPPLPGVVVDAAAALDDRRAWLFLAHRHGGKVRHLCFVYARNGTLEGSAEAEPGDGGWLSALHGKCAAGGFLFAGTDAGLVRVEVTAGAVAKTRDFPGTAEFVDEASRLLVGRRGLFVAGAREVLALEMK